MPDTITIVVPCDPPSVLLPNQRRKHHWGTISKATRELREIAYYAALDQRPNDWTPFAEPVVLSLRVGYGRRRRIPDLDASASACKAIIDSMIDAGIISDDRIITKLVVRHGKDPKGEGYAILSFQPDTDDSVV